jgi:BlaI family transcriptional regulator, penicillinase repressor
MTVDSRFSPEEDCMSPNKPAPPATTQGAPDILETEWDILDALWTAERATAREVAQAVEAKRGWAYSTVKTLLDRMVEKGLVHGRQVGNVWEYTPAVPRRRAQRWAWRRFVDVAFGGAVAPTLAFVAKETRLTKEQRAELRALLAKLEEDDHE